MLTRILTALFVVLALPTLLSAQDGSTFADWFGANVIVPQQRAYRMGPAADGVDDGRMIVSAIRAEVEIVGDVATTTLVTRVDNNYRPDEVVDNSVQLLLPVPKDAELLEAPISGPTDAPNAVRLNLTDDEAVDAYLAGARALNVPELLEFSGTRLVLAGPYEIDRGESREITLTYRQTLIPKGNRIDYRLPRSESFDYASTPWSITLTLRSPEPIAALYSPSHSIAYRQDSPTEAVVSVESSSLRGGSNSLPDDFTPEEKTIDPGDFSLSILRGAEVEAAFTSFAEAQSTEGCFLMLLGANGSRSEENAGVKREVILVIDRSGSMSGEKIAQARQAAKNVVSSLRDGETFTIVDYDDDVQTFETRPVVVNASNRRRGLAYIDGIEDDGGTNIHDALRTAVMMPPTAGHLPIVIFLTDGLPTSGITGEDSIRRGVISANVHNRRIFTFGVGYDVNAPLLDALARESGGSTTFVLPGESVDASVDLLFRKLNGPVFSDITLRVERPDGSDASHLVRDMMPQTFSDLYEGDYLTALGHFTVDRSIGDIIFVVSGNYLGSEREFRFTFKPMTRDFDQDATHLCRLWASRRINENIDRISRDGAIPESERTDEDRERFERQSEEIFELSMANGIINEYTEHLSEGTMAFAEFEVMAEEMGDTMSAEEIAGSVALTKLKDRAQDTRSGKGAVNQVLNKSAKMSSGGGKASKAQMYYDADMNVVEIRSVQQIGEHSFFRRDGRWVEAAALDSAEATDVDETLRFGTDDYDRFVRDLIAEGNEEILALRGEILLRRGGRLVLVAGVGELE